MKLCNAPECAGPAIALGWCTKHYQRLKSHGDAMATVESRTYHGAVVRDDMGRRRPAPEYTSWQQMRDRCLNVNSKNYQYYGGRGIKICDQWSSFQKFLADIGSKPSRGHTLDRIDSNGNYEPNNCRWATRAEQSRNRRPFRVNGLSHPLAKPIVINGRTNTISGWAREMGVRREVIRGRLHRGWDQVRAVTEPVGTSSSGPKGQRP